MKLNSYTITQGRDRDSTMTHGNRPSIAPLTVGLWLPYNQQEC